MIDIILKFEPMEPILITELQKSEEYIHQVKWDGIRGICFLNDDKLNLKTKKGIDRTEFYPEIKEIFNITDVKNAIFDGEIIRFKDGIPSFSEVLKRERIRNKKNINTYINKYPIYYVIFDIVYLNDKDLRFKDFQFRYDKLKKVITQHSNIIIAENYIDGEKLYENMKSKGMEGIVSKKLTSRYIKGKKHNDWYKLKINRKMLCIICGIVMKNNTPKSLILGIKDEEFRYVGRVYSGLSIKELSILNEYKSLLSTGVCPFNGERYKNKEVIWFKPKLTCWVSFLEWTDQGVLRHPKIVGFSSNSIEKANGSEYVE